MRIVAGTLKGRMINAPDGLDTRPTTDRVREALFSSLFSLLGGFDGLVVLDAFAGSGALGIEALSRGAARAVFYEHDAKAAATLKRNLETCGIGPDKAQIIRRDVLKAEGADSTAPYNLVFLDPPYAYDPATVLELASKLDAGAVIVYEHALDSRKQVDAAAQAAGLDILTSKKYGKTGITILEA